MMVGVRIVVMIITMRAFNSSGSADGIKMRIIMYSFMYYFSKWELTGMHALVCLHNRIA